jgi:transcriptional regulator with AAA-type ATPase domain
MVKKQNGMIITPGLREPLAQFEDVCTYFKLLRKPIIIRGPRGVGKTLFVQKFIGVNPKVTTGKVIQRNIAALQPNLIESELFGHEKGAFTGATEKKIGLLEQAEDGLLVLEEIGDIPKWVQAKLLTVLEDGNFQRVGGKNNLNIGQLWFFGTTNKPDRAFRPDFLDRFYHFKVPAIHERRGDVLYYLCGLFPTLFEALTSKEVLELLAHPWPGGVREIERVGQEIEIGLLDESICKAKHAGVSSQPCHSHHSASCLNRMPSLGQQCNG